MPDKSNEKQENKKDLSLASASKLIAAINRGEDSTLKQKVAHILNHFPAARDSDITLTIRLLDTFYSDYVDSEQRIFLKSMYDLPKFYDMQRIRAKIQNEYGLFLASPEVQAFRKQKQYKKAEDFASTKPDYNSVSVFTDESGKDQNYLAFGSLWVYSPNEQISLLKALYDWRRAVKCNDELHFKEIKNQDKAQLALDFFKVVINLGCYISFKCLLVNSKGVNSARMVDAMYEGITHMLIQGIKTEIKSRRATPPLKVHLAKDADPATDVLKLADLNLKTIAAFQTVFSRGEASLESVSNPLSESNDLIQITDLLTASVGRWVNQGVPVSESNAKELFARELGNLLRFRVNKNGRINCRSDSCTIEYFSSDIEIT